MKKMLIIINITLILIGCKNIENLSVTIYNNYIEELKEIKSSSENIPFDINIEVEQQENNITSYTVLVDRKNIAMKNIEAIIIHNKETENIFPSIGIFDEKINLDETNSKKGIKLTGYLENNNNIEFKFMIKYINDSDKEEKYYLTYNYRQ